MDFNCFAFFWRFFGVSILHDFCVFLVFFSCCFSSSFALFVDGVFLCCFLVFSVYHALFDVLLYSPIQAFQFQVTGPGQVRRPNGQLQRYDQNQTKA